MRFAIKPPGCDPLAAGRTRPAAGVGMPNLPHQWRGAKSIADDLGPMRGVVLSRATTSLRSIETQPFASRFVLHRRTRLRRDQHGGRTDGRASERGASIEAPVLPARPVGQPESVTRRWGGQVRPEGDLSAQQPSEASCVDGDREAGRTTGRPKRSHRFTEFC